MDFVHPICVAHNAPPTTFRRVKKCDRDRVFADLYNFVLEREIENASMLEYVELLCSLQSLKPITPEDAKDFFNKTRSDYLSRCILANYMNPKNYAPSVPEVELVDTTPEFVAIGMLAKTFGFTRRVVDQLVTSAVNQGTTLSF